MSSNAVNSDSKPKSWSETFTLTEESVSLNKIHKEVVDLFKVTDANELDESSRQKMIDSAKDLPLDAFIIKSPVDESIQVLHHCSKIGGDLLNKESIYFSLYGAEFTAIPVVFKPKSILTIAKVDCPSWTTLQAIKTKTDFLNAAPAAARPKSMFLTNGIPIPPFLTAAIIGLDCAPVYNVFMACQAAAKAFDKENKDDATVPESTETMKVILTFLWAAHHNKIASVATQPSARPEIVQKLSELHLAFLTTDATPPKNNGVDLTKNPSV